MAQIISTALPNADRFVHRSEDTYNLTSVDATGEAAVFDLHPHTEGFGKRRILRVACTHDTFFNVSSYGTASAATGPSSFTSASSHAWYLEAGVHFIAIDHFDYSQSENLWYNMGIWVRRATSTDVDNIQVGFVS